MDAKEMFDKVLQPVSSLIPNKETSIEEISIEDLKNEQKHKEEISSRMEEMIEVKLSKVVERIVEEKLKSLNNILLPQKKETPSTITNLVQDPKESGGSTHCLNEVDNTPKKKPREPIYVKAQNELKPSSSQLYDERTTVPGLKNNSGIKEGGITIPKSSSTLNDVFENNKYILSGFTIFFKDGADTISETVRNEYSNVEEIEVLFHNDKFLCPYKGKIILATFNGVPEISKDGVLLKRLIEGEWKGTKR